MGTSTAELNRQIEETRSQMTRDVDALQDRVSPSAIVERRKAAARSRLGSVKDSVMGTASSAASGVTGSAGSAGDAVGSAAGSGRDAVEGSPLAAGLVAFGAGMLLSALVPASRTEAQVAQQVVDSAKEKAQPLAQDVAASAQEAGSQLREQLGQAAQDVKQTATESTEQVRDQVGSATEEVRAEAPGT